MYEGLPGHKRGLLFFVAICVVFMQAGLWAGRRETQNNFPDNSLVKASSLLALVKSDSRTSIKEHPIPKLMAEAENSFRRRLAGQSKTLAEAVAEYKRRYGRNPPRGFDRWWQFAKDNNVLMVDEYDAVVEDLAPFWDVDSAELRERASAVCDKLIMLSGLLNSLPGRKPTGH